MKKPAGRHPARDQDVDMVVEDKEERKDVSPRFSSDDDDEVNADDAGVMVGQR